MTTTSAKCEMDFQPKLRLPNGGVSSSQGISVQTGVIEENAPQRLSRLPKNEPVLQDNKDILHLLAEQQSCKEKHIMGVLINQQARRPCWRKHSQKCHCAHGCHVSYQGLQALFQALLLCLLPLCFTLVVTHVKVTQTLNAFIMATTEFPMRILKKIYIFFRDKSTHCKRESPVLIQRAD